MSKKVAVVTGSNKGIGFAIVKILCKQFDGDVILTARDEGRGQEAVKELQKEGLSPKFHILDCDNPATSLALKDHLQKEYGGLDVLVNNAGIAFKNADTTPFGQQAVVTIKTNYFGLLSVCDALFPLLRSGARVVNVSSMTAAMAFKKCSAAAKQRVLQVSPVSALSDLMKEFVADAGSGEYKAKGWADSSYGMSKLGVRRLSELQQQDLDADSSRSDVVINACCPGWVNTDMSSHKGPKSPAEGADTPVYLSLLPPGTDIKGKFVANRKVEAWPQ